MAILLRTEFGNPLLRKRAKRVTPSQMRTKAFKTLVKNMIATMRKTNGVGLAAPQVGKSFQLTVLETRPTKTRPNLPRRGPYVVINPNIITKSKATRSDWEGCLSFDNVRALVPRAKSITVSFTNELGKHETLIVDGLWARIFQHEIDHLHGVTFVDHVTDSKSYMTVNEFMKRVVKKRKK